MPDGEAPTIMALLTDTRGALRPPSVRMKWLFDFQSISRKGDFDRYLRVTYSGSHMIHGNPGSRDGHDSM